jgi:hypothetical protein
MKEYRITGFGAGQKYSKSCVLHVRCVEYINEEYK